MPSAIVDRQMFPRHTNRTDIGSEAMIAGCHGAAMIAKAMRLGDFARIEEYGGHLADHAHRP